MTLRWKIRRFLRLPFNDKDRIELIVNIDGVVDEIKARIKEAEDE